MYFVCTRDGSHYQHFAIIPGEEKGHPNEAIARVRAEQLAAKQPGRKITVIRLVATFVADQVREIPE